MKNENKIKHLEFIQLTITRMNINSFMIKGWLVTIVAAIFVLSEKNVRLVFWGVIPCITGLFWMLDGFFISTERKYRSLYDHVRTLYEDSINYSMDTTAYKTKKNSVIASIFSTTLLLFYPAIILASILASTLLKK